jgi:hypothetical protein
MKAKTGRILLLCVVSLAVGACSEIPQPPMTAAEAAAYNQCMQPHWSSAADAMVFGVAGYEYHQNVVLGCQQFALIGDRATVGTATSAGQPVAQPVSATAPAVQPTKSQADASFDQ